MRSERCLLFPFCPKSGIQHRLQLDGDAHGPAGLCALAEAAGDDERAWEAARCAAESAIAARIALWDSVHAELQRIDSPHA